MSESAPVQDGTLYKLEITGEAEVIPGTPKTEEEEETP